MHRLPSCGRAARWAKTPVSVVALAGGGDVRIRTEAITRVARPLIARTCRPPQKHDAALGIDRGGVF